MSLERIVETSLYTEDWLDSAPERDVANMLEDEESIALRVRLQTGDLPILWTNACEHNPDVVALQRDDTHWVIEVKMDKEMESADVQGEREAARHWANYVSADERLATTWRAISSSRRVT